VTLKAGAPVELGDVEGAKRRFIPILGAAWRPGQNCRAKSCRAAATGRQSRRKAWQRSTRRYFLKLDDGTVVEVSTPACASQVPMWRSGWRRGEDVDPNLYYYRITPQLRVKSGAQDWLGKTVFVAKGARRPDRVTFDFFAVE
jgi:hypothetical protein